MIRTRCYGLVGKMIPSRLCCLGFRRLGLIHFR
jgi:hypothetical protein